MITRRSTDSVNVPAYIEAMVPPGKRHDGDRVKALLANRWGNVLDVFEVRIGTAEGPLGVAVAAQIRRHDMESVAHRLGQPIPGVAVVVDAVNQQHVGRVVVSPVQVVQPQALGE